MVKEKVRKVGVGIGSVNMYKRYKYRKAGNGCVYGTANILLA